jgi:hypothetical protein
MAGGPSGPCHPYTTPKGPGRVLTARLATTLGTETKFNEILSLPCHVVHWWIERKGVVFKAGLGPLA